MRFILITTLLLIALTTRAQQVFNGNFENLGANGKPAGWNMAFTGSPSYKTKLDSVTKRQGKYSVSIAYDTGKVSYEAIIFPIKQRFVGKSLMLIGSIKTENVVGDAGLFLGINGAGGQIAAANMHDQKLSGTHDWKEYYIQLEYNEGDAISLDAGAYLMGTGKIWVDSLRLYLDETPINKAPIATFKALKDTAFANGSGISSLPTDKASVANLTLMGQLWGFLKYHHPAIARGDYDWDNELFRLLPQFTKLTTNAQVSALLEKWVDGLGKVQPCKTYRPMANQKDIAVRPNYGNLFNNTVFAKSLTQKLNYILANHDSTYNYYIRLPFIPSFTHEKAYNTPYPDAGCRLLALFRYWNIIQYFSPNRTLISEGWNNMLPRFIPQFAGARNKTEYALAVNKLLAHLHDGHAFIISSAIGEYQGNYRLPVAARFAEGKLVVVGYYKDTLEAKKLFKPGDVITEINGHSVSSLVKKYLPLMSSSNMAGKLRDMPGFYLLRSQQKLFDLTVLRDGQTVHIKARAADASQINDYNWSAHPKTAGYALINKDIGYIYPALYKNSMLDDIKKTFKNTKGIIIDMRCYPSDDMDQTIGNYIKPFNSAFVKFTYGSLRYPGLFTYYKPVTTGKKSPDNYKGKVVVIVNEITQSNAEFVTMAFQTSPNVTVIGSTTAGADGNITPINLPGNFSTYISGLGVYYPDGTNAQRKGVKIDLVVRPTIKGIRENRDEVLERAKALIN